MSTNNELRITLFTLYALAASVPSSAGTWGTQAELATNAYNGTVAIDASGNLNSVWYQNALPNGTAVNEIWASSAAFGHSWSTPVNISGPIGVASGNPSVRGSASGNVTAIYTNQNGNVMYVTVPREATGGPLLESPAPSISFTSITTTVMRVWPGARVAPAPGRRQSRPWTVPRAALGVPQPRSPLRRI